MHPLGSDVNPNSRGREPGVKYLATLGEARDAAQVCKIGSLKSRNFRLRNLRLRHSRNAGIPSGAEAHADCGALRVRLTSSPSSSLNETFRSPFWLRRNACQAGTPKRRFTQSNFPGRFVAAGASNTQMILMPLKRKFVHAALIGLLASPAGGAFASDLKSTLSRLDQAAASFKSTSADFEFDTNQTDPVPNTEVLKGTVYYERKGTNFQMAAHIETDDGKKAPKIYSFSQGVFRLDE